MAGKRKVDGDFWLAGAVALVWAILAGLYEFVPALTMPGSAGLWGGGAGVFAAIAAAIAWTRRNANRDAPGTSGDGRTCPEGE